MSEQEEGIETMPKKTAALEVYKELKKVKMLGFSVIGASFIVAIASYFHIWGGAITAGIFTVLGSFAVKNAIERMKYFESQYNIKPAAK